MPTRFTNQDIDEIMRLLRARGFSALSPGRDPLAGKAAADHNHAGVYAAAVHDHAGVYEPTIAAGSAGQFLKHDKTFGTPPISFALQVSSASANPADGVSYYINMPFTALGSTPNIRPIYLREACRLDIVEFVWLTTATAGTAENINVYVRKNNTSDTLVATVGSVATRKVFTNSAMNLSFAANDFFEIKVTCPTWVTNPTAVIMYGYCRFKGV